MKRKRSFSSGSNPVSGRSMMKTFGGGGASSFLVTDLPDLFFAIEADQLGTAYADTDPVGSAADLSSNSFDVSALTTARPTFRADEMNGHPVLEFDGTTDTLTTASGSGAHSTITYGYVFKDWVISATNYENFLSSGEDTRLGIFNGGNANPEISRPFGGNAWSHTLGTAMPSDGFLIITLNGDDNELGIYLNGDTIHEAAPDSSPTSPIDSSITFNGIRVGTTFPDRFANGKLALAFIQTSIITADDRDAMFDTYMAKYGL